MEIWGKMVKISYETYKKLLNNSITVKQNKYHNKKVVYNGIKFDSIKEKNYYITLKLLEQSGQIKDLELQKEYVLIPKFEVNGKIYRKTSYFADFTFVSTKDDRIHVVDTKGVKTDVYKLKKKLMIYKYKIEIEEI